MKKTIGALFLSMSLLTGTISQLGCGGGPDDVRELKTTLKNIAATLNTAAKTNRSLYQSKIITLEVRQKIAKGVHAANEVTIAAIETAKTITAANFQGTKEQIVTLLNTGLTELQAVNIGNPTIDLVIQSAVALINNALLLANALKRAGLKYVTPMLHSLTTADFMATRQAYAEGGF